MVREFGFPIPVKLPAQASQHSLPTGSAKWPVQEPTITRTAEMAESRNQGSGCQWDFIVDKGERIKTYQKRIVNLRWSQRFYILFLYSANISIDKISFMDLSNIVYNTSVIDLFLHIETPSLRKQDAPPWGPLSCPGPAWHDPGSATAPSLSMPKQHWKLEPNQLKISVSRSWHSQHIIKMMTSIPKKSNRFVLSNLLQNFLSPCQGISFLTPCISYALA